MTVTKQWLTNNIATLNDWLQNYEAGYNPEYAQNKQKRDYYVNKLIEVEENGLSTIKL